jgi:hypothetical protein
MVLVHRQGRYDRLIFKFSHDFSKYACRVEKAVECKDINFVTLENGVVVHIHREGSLEIFFRKRTDDRIKIIQDQEIRTDMVLFKSGINVRFARGRKVFKMSVKDTR